jgi:hypothetical protein
MLRIAALAEMLGQQATHRKWRVVADLSPESVPSAPEFLFLTRDGSPVTRFDEAEPVFAKHGLLLGKLEHRGMFIHYNIAAYHDRQWATGREDPATFKPDKLDCNQQQIHR